MKVWVYLTGFLKDFRYQPSWGRFVSAVALAEAVWGQNHGMDVPHLEVWLITAGGGYGLSKLTEMVVAHGQGAPCAAPPAPQES